ncbi:hypothetical protein OSB04_027771 [Centaurea solstitialis]|uniref:Retrotransposon Copia-like N-terminal domain-containing protein n=1 Tax=Centaurea solstitialis TaxID=347529 RepID=A0AA38W752_9ASTR|nr:hypothetical protein OSB04_027771 [Centaurea solstitialis]
MPEVAEGVRNADQNQNQSHNRNQSFSMANITNFVSIKLNGENYLSWKHQVLTILKTLGLSKHVSADQSSPLESDPEYENWSKADCYVSACINATLDQSVAHLAIGTGTALDLWKVLEDSYLQQAFAKKFQLKTQFQTLKQGSSTVTVFCDSIKRVADSLRSIGEKVSEADLVLQTLQGLNSVFNTFVLNIENSENLPNFVQLRSRLLVYEERLNNQVESTTGSISAMNSSVFTPPHSGSEMKQGMLVEIIAENKVLVAET